MSEDELERAARDLLEAVDRAENSDVLAKAIAKVRRAIQGIDAERADIARRRSMRAK